MSGPVAVAAATATTPAHGRRARRAVGVALAAAALALPACSRTDSAAPPPPTGTALAGTTTTVWANRPDPCALLTDAVVASVVGFDVSTGPLSAADGGGPDTCAWRNANFGLEGGAVTLRVRPPGSDLNADRSRFRNVADVPGLGVGAFTGAVPGVLGPGITGVVVDMGNGGFGIVASTYQVRNQAEMVQLATAAAQRWQVLSSGGTLAEPGSVPPGTAAPGTTAPAPPTSAR